MKNIKKLLVSAACAAVLGVVSVSAVAAKDDSHNLCIVAANDANPLVSNPAVKSIN